MGKQTAINYLTGLLSELGGDTVDLCVAAAWDTYRWQHVEPNLAAKQQADWCWNNLERHFGQVSVREIDQIMVNRYVAARVKGAIGRPSKPSSARRELSYLRAALRYASGPHAQLFPRSMLPIFELPKASPPRERWVTLSEFQSLLDAARTMRRGARLSKLEIFLWLSIETGGRRQALLDLTWGQVDFEIGVVHLDIPGQVRTHKRRASVPMSRNLRMVLERAHSERQNYLVLGNANSGLWRSLQVAAIKAGFSDQQIVRGKKPKATGISPHAFRRSAATLMARNGVSFYTIGQVLGISAATAERHYAKHAPVPASQSTDFITGSAASVVVPAD
ncbi:tyrosine-type recombinase/integrase [Devosia marina]|uniref:Tyrosine-type recombinase/integrase n=1 Tax=Devosia marina TaxID=2683198 RepID=A0A7X3FPF4_9HYPH|nr:tyrosine-type recombinase/integrase [Devosia marina]